MKRILFFSSIILLLVAVHLYIGTPITLFLSVTVIASLLYYMASMWNEQSIEKASLLHHEKDDAFKHFMNLLKNKRFAFMSTTLMTVVFLASMYCIKKVVNPTKEHAWFLNVDHHALRNTGIGFKNNALFSIENNDSVDERSSIQFNSNATNYNLSTENFFNPIFQQLRKNNFRLVNPLYNQSIENKVEISNADYKVNIQLKKVQHRTWYKPWQMSNRLNYHVVITCTNQSRLQELGLSNTWSDEFTIENQILNKGILLKSLLQESNIALNAKPETSQIIEDFLSEVGDSYLLVSYTETGEKQFYLFPNEELLANQYKVYIDNKAVSFQNNNRFSIEPKLPFYIGLGNQKTLLTIDTFKNQHAILFDFPQAYYLSSPEKLQAGVKNIKFITNNINQLINEPLKEGLYFQNNIINTSDYIHGNIEYIADNTNKSLAANFTDFNASNINAKEVVNQTFELKSNSGNLTYYFDLRDFSDNGFSFNHILGYGIYLFLLFTSLLLFKRGKKLERLEPILWVTIYSLIMLRFVMYWRLATFPPLENITKYELENTLIGFDFSLLGYSIPFPSTLVFTTLIVLFIAIFRLGLFDKWKFPNLSISYLQKYNLNQSQKTIVAYALFLAICMLINVFVGIDFLKRIVTILMPLLGYTFVSSKMNENYAEQKFKVNQQDNGIIQYGKAFLHYLIHNPTFYITILSIGFFAIADRGFCILFILFILLKNVVLNFLKKTYSPEKSNLFAMFIKPWHYWIYGILSLVIYFLVLSMKSIFYYALTYKLYVIGFVLLVSFLMIHFFYRTKRKLWLITLSTCVIYLLLLLIPFTRNYIDVKITDKIKFVQHRASIIHQPISQLLEQNPYSSFNTKKIIETAENQWFINSYINKPFDNSMPINLRKFSKIGVNYNTQTRDVVVARFVIGEMGPYVMTLILLLFVLPLFLYLLSYKLKDEVQSSSFNIQSYGGLIPLLLLFTISLFVWLTSTNRFVFFGQDFPFLSLTSRLSVLLPLLLFALVLIRKPIAYHSLNINFKIGAFRYIILLIGIISFGYSTFKNNELSNDNFSVVVKSTQSNIDVKFNAILSEIQDSISTKTPHYSYAKLAKIVMADNRYKEFKNNECSDVYTKSIFDAWEKNPQSAMKLNNPLYFRYDQGVYLAEYNKSLYLDLPITDNKNVWHGKLVEGKGTQSKTVNLQYGLKNINCQLPFFDEDVTSGIQLAIVPASWFTINQQITGLINVNNQYLKEAQLQIQKANSSSEKQSSTTFVHSLQAEDQVFVKSGTKSFGIHFKGNGQAFAFHKWVNNEYRTIYPQHERNFWLYHFINTIKPVYADELNSNVDLSIDYSLYEQIQKKLNNMYAKPSSHKKNFNFSVIAADGDGNIRLMNDFVANRKQIDPNNKNEIYKLQQKHFFYSNTKNERDQWGNSNLLNLHFGPGSSIKPLIMACVSSQANVGWEQLKYIPEIKKDKEAYGGLKLSHPWKDDEHYFANTIDIPTYIEQSSNFYHSLIMFLGSYKRSNFGTDSLSLKNILTKKAGTNNSFPKISLEGQAYYLPNYSNGKWPASGDNKIAKSYFAQENSLLANGLSINANLITSDVDKLDGSPMSTQKTYFVDSNLQKRIMKSNINNAIWTMPEASIFPQKMRHYISSKKKNEINENFNLGLKTATLGGYPYQLTPFKMLEMYNALFTFNRNYTMQITPTLSRKQNWQVDSSWTMLAFKTFLAENVFEGMKRVIHNGTAKQLNVFNATFPQYHFYAKTGTINEEGGGESSSKRLIVTLTDKDMTLAENIGNGTKVYSWYFVADNTGNFNWDLLREIITTSITSNSFQQYMNK